MCITRDNNRLGADVCVIVPYLTFARGGHYPPACTCVLHMERTCELDAPGSSPERLVQHPNRAGDQSGAGLRQAHPAFVWRACDLKTDKT